jgi:hypothetical protein
MPRAAQNNAAATLTIAAKRMDVTFGSQSDGGA